MKLLFPTFHLQHIEQTQFGMKTKDGFDMPCRFLFTTLPHRAIIELRLFGFGFEYTWSLTDD